MSAKEFSCYGRNPTKWGDDVKVVLIFIRAGGLQKMSKGGKKENGTRMPEVGASRRRGLSGFTQIFKKLFF
jgi:hypothetical protein